MLDKLIGYYYSNIGEEPTDSEFKITKGTIAYLIDNEFDEKQIIEIMNGLDWSRTFSNEDLPDYLWEDSLIERNKFYYHNLLQIRSMAPVLNKITGKLEMIEKDYIEMKIMFTINDLISYFYSKFYDLAIFEDKNRDVGAVKHMLNEYKRLDKINPLDFFLYSIDKCSSDKSMITNIFDIKKVQMEVFKELTAKATSAKALKINKIIWRSY